jgi:phospholipase C
VIKNVFVLMLENRSFDHMLGFSGLTGTDAVTGDPTQINGLAGTESNSYNETTYQVSQPADYSMPVGPGHEFTDVVVQLCGQGAVYPPNVSYPVGGQYPDLNNSGFVADYAANNGASSTDGVGEIMKCYSSSTNLPVLYTLAQQFAVCDQWYSSMPGPTWPNRFFAVAASSGGLDHSPTTADMAEWMGPDGFSFQHGAIFDVLNTQSIKWSIYRGDEFPITTALTGITILDTISYDDFEGDVSASNPNYQSSFTWIEPDYGDFGNGTYLGGNSEHPIDDVTNGEALIKSVYEAIRNSPIWDSSLLIVTWDEHGGFYDHVEPPAAPAPGDTITAPIPPFSSPQINEYGFNFEQYGVRVPAVVVSAYTPQNLIDHRLYDHASIPATVEAIFGLPSMTQRDASANNVTPLVSLQSARTDAPTTLPNPATSGLSSDTILAAAEAAAAKRPPLTMDEENMPGFLHVAMRSDLALSPRPERPAIVARVKAIKTRDEAAQYIEEVRQKIRALDAARKVRPRR